MKGYHGELWTCWYRDSRGTCGEEHPISETNTAFDSLGGIFQQLEELSVSFGEAEPAVLVGKRDWRAAQGRQLCKAERLDEGLGREGRKLL